jgi:integrase/recombinase XerD
MKTYIHDYEKTLERLKVSIKKSEISEKNKKIISDYETHLVITDISMPRVIKYLQSLKTIALNMKVDFDKVTKKDIEAFISFIQTKNYAENTKKDFKVTLKKFYKWLRNTGDVFPEEVRWLKANIKVNLTKLPQDLITEKEAYCIMDHAPSIRDKALISVLYESGARIGEIGIMQIKDVEFDKQGILVSICGKTGARKIRLISSTSYLSNWLSMHPFKDDRQAYVWINTGNYNRGKMLKYANIGKMLRQTAVKAGIKKRVNPHNFRHSRATMLAKHLTESQLKNYLGWVQSSKMAGVYVHMSGRDTDNAILKLNGMKTSQNTEESEITPKICERCDTINPTDAKFCVKCAGVLDLKTAFELEEKMKLEREARSESDNIMRALMKDPDVRQMLANKIKEIGIKV